MDAIHQVQGQLSGSFNVTSINNDSRDIQNGKHRHFVSNTNNNHRSLNLSLRLEAGMPTTMVSSQISSPKVKVKYLSLPVLMLCISSFSKLHDGNEIPVLGFGMCAQILQKISLTENRDLRTGWQRGI
jgi:hypothetical protein